MATPVTIPTLKLEPPHRAFAPSRRSRFVKLVRWVVPAMSRRMRVASTLAAAAQRSLRTALEIRSKRRWRPLPSTTTSNRYSAVSANVTVPKIARTINSWLSRRRFKRGAEHQRRPPGRWSRAQRGVACGASMLPIAGCSPSTKTQTTCFAAVLDVLCGKAQLVAHEDQQTVKPDEPNRQNPTFPHPRSRRTGRGSCVPLPSAGGETRTLGPARRARPSPPRRSVAARLQKAAATSAPPAMASQRAEETEQPASITGGRL